MYKFQIFVLLFLITVKFNAQELSAKVVDENNEPLTGATVYFDGTSRGVLTNPRGIFNINIPQNLTNPTLVISFMGYQTMFETNIQNLKPVYQLKPKSENLDAVDLYSSPFTREEMFEVFKKYFLGNDRASKKCKILNPEDIILYYVVKENKLYAKASAPIMVDNPYLGYKVRFDLEAFEIKYTYKTLSDHYLKQTFYAGFSFFEDVNPKKESKRIKTYKGSLNHFFKKLIDSTLQDSKFKVAYRGFIAKPYNVFSVKPLGFTTYEISLKSNYIKLFNGKYLPTKLLLIYKKQRSTIQFSKPVFRVSNYGNLIDLQNLLLIGDLSENRIAKMLPVTFNLEKTFVE